MRAEQAAPKLHRTIAQMLKLDPEKPDEQEIINRMVNSFDCQRFQQLLVEWIVTENLPFTIAEQPGLRAIFKYLNPQVRIREANLTRNSIRSRIVMQYGQHLAKVIDALRAAPGLIHLVFDGWRSGNRKNVIGLTCVFPGADYQPRKITLGMPEMPGRYQGEEIARVVGNLVTQFEIEDKLGTCVTDNASNNDTAMDHLGDRFSWNSWTGRKRRARCFGYILNLAAKLLLHGNAEQPVETFVETNEQLTDAEYDLWRKEGLVGKLRILVLAIDISDRLLTLPYPIYSLIAINLLTLNIYRLTALFYQIQQADISNAQTARDRSKKPLHVVKDNQTRWLGSLYMIRRALRLRLYFEELKVKFGLE